MHIRYDDIDFFIYPIGIEKIPSDEFSDSLPIKILFGGTSASNKDKIVSIIKDLMHKNITYVMFYGDFDGYIHDKIDYIIEDSNKDIVTFSVNDDSSYDILYDMVQRWDDCGDSFQCILFLDFLDEKSIDIVKLLNDKI